MGSQIASLFWILALLAVVLALLNMYSPRKQNQRMPKPDQSTTCGWTNTAVRRQGKAGKGIR